MHVVAGQLSDDVESIQELLDPQREIFLWHDLAHICGVLRRIAVMDEPGRHGRNTQ
jgi:hypothetical protein